MKKLLTLILSLMLMITPVLAADPGDQFREDPAAKGKQSIMNQLLSITTAGVGTATLACCGTATLIPSLITFNIGAIIYIASELLAGKAHNDYLKKSADGLKMTDEKLKAGGNAQRESVEAALKNEKKILEFIEKRMKWQNIIKIVYGLATVLALTEVLKIPIPFAPPPGQIGVCVPGAFTPFSAGLVLALIAAWTYNNMSNSSGLGSIGALAATLTVLFTSVGNMLLGVLNTAPGRVAAFGIATATVVMNVNSLKEKADVAKGNIEKLEGVLKQMDVETQESTQTPTLAQDAGANSQGATPGTSMNAAGAARIANQTSGGSLAGASGVTAAAGTEKLLPEFDGNKNCISQTEKGTVVGSDCSKTVSFKSPAVGIGLEGLDPIVQEATTATVDMGNAMAAGDSAAANVGATKLASLAARIEKVKEDLMKKVNEDLKARGKPQIDFEKEQRDSLQLQMAAIQKGMTEGKLEVPQASVPTAASLKSETTGPMKINSSEPVVPSTAAAAPSAQPVAESVATVAETSGPAPTLSESLESMEVEENDISKNKDDSLFERVSNRYKKSYDRFLIRKEVTD